MVQQNDRIMINVDVRTAQLLRQALYDLSEHQAAGVPIKPYDSEESRLIGKFLSDLDKMLGGIGRMA